MAVRSPPSAVGWTVAVTTVAMIFIDLRDRTGTVQVTVDAEGSLQVFHQGSTCAMKRCCASAFMGTCGLKGL